MLLKDSHFTGHDSLRTDEASRLPPRSTLTALTRKSSQDVHSTEINKE